jgi:hypothetical protein
MVVRVHWQAMLVVCRMHWRRRLRSGFRGVLTPLWLPLQLVDIIHPNLPPVKREIVAAELAKVRYSRRNEFGRRRFPFSPPWVMVPRDVLLLRRVFHRCTRRTSRMLLCLASRPPLVREVSRFRSVICVCAHFSGFCTIAAPCTQFHGVVYHCSVVISQVVAAPLASAWCTTTRTR